MARRRDARSPHDDPVFRGRAATDAWLAPALLGFVLIVLSDGTGATHGDLAWLGATLAARTVWMLPPNIQAARQQCN
jgi:hypothetical protein